MYIATSMYVQACLPIFLHTPSRGVVNDCVSCFAVALKGGIVGPRLIGADGIS